MLALTWSTIRARGRQAIIVMLLAAAAVGAAVAASVYVDAARQRVLADDVASATAAEQSITAAAQARFAADTDSQVQQTQLANTRQNSFAETAPNQLRLGGFTTISAAGYPAFVADQPWHEGQDQ